MRIWATGTGMDIFESPRSAARPTRLPAQSGDRVVLSPLRRHQLRELREDGETAEHKNDEKHRDCDDRPQPDQRAVTALEQLWDDRIIRFRLARLVGSGPLSPVQQRERTRLRPGSVIRLGGGCGDTRIFICQLSAYLD